MSRALILVMDSLGLGATPDAEAFGDVGANTLGHIADWCAAGNSCTERDVGPLRVPNLTRLGLGKAAELAAGAVPKGFETDAAIIGMYAACEEISSGKDTPSGHWEMTGVPVRYEWGYFPTTKNCFPDELMEKFLAETGIAATLANCHASGTDILDKLGDEHIRTGHPICYTSSDSVFQIAAHEEHFGLDRLYEICEIARKLVDPYNIGRVIARPFIGKNGNYTRTGNRRDYATPPHAETLLDKLATAGHDVISVGKIADIFAHRGISHKIKATGHDALFDATIQALADAKEGSLIFTNFVEFDQSFGHRRNVGGYADAIEHFDTRITEVMDAMGDDDLLILTADHGCDPTWVGTDHTREHIPFVAYRPNHKEALNGGIRSSFSDIGQTVANHLSIAPLDEGFSVF